MKNKRLLALDDLVACQACDWLHHRRQLAVGEQANCQRCGHVMQTRKAHTVDRALAGSIAGIILLLLSLSLPFLSLSRAGIASSISVLDAVESLWMSDMRWLGLLTLSFIVVLPLARFLLLVWVLVRIRCHRRVRRGMRMAFRWALALEPWAMADIFMVGVAVSLVKISALAKLEVGLAFWSLMGLIAVTIFISLSLCKDTVWTYLTRPA